jgi:8-oxo-dGTP diphosphatase
MKTLPQLLLRKKARSNTVTQLVGAGVACLNHAGELLMVRRGDNGHWDLPGGQVEPGEEVEVAARRELWEETGLHATATQLLGVFSGPDTLHTYPDGNTVAWVTVLYLCRAVPGDPVAADDARQAGWFRLDALPLPRSGATERYLHTLRTHAPL